MKKTLLISIIFLATFLFAEAQENYVPGYVVTVSGEKKNCQIDLEDWQSTPQKFTYQFTSDAKPLIGTTENIVEFGIDNGPKYVRFTVERDISPKGDQYLTISKEPDMKSETLFLEALVLGQIDLYHYSDGANIQLFYKKDANISQLIYKQYNSPEGIRTNDFFRNQISAEVNCNGRSLSDIGKLKYNRKAMAEYFVKYHECLGLPYEDLQSEEAERLKEKIGVALTLRGGRTTSSTFVDWRSGWFYDAQFETVSHLRIGAELEIAIPGSNGNVAVLLEPYYSEFSATAPIESNSRPDNNQVTIDYSYLFVSIGLRYYYTVTPNHRFFINGNVDLGESFDSQVKYDFIANAFSINNNMKASFSVGYAFANRLFLEYRHQSNSNLIPSSAEFSTQYKSSSVILGFRIIR